MGDAFKAQATYKLEKDIIKLPADENEPFKDLNAYDGVGMSNRLFLRELRSLFEPGATKAPR